MDRKQRVMVDSWDAVISALGKYQIESWRSGYVQAINESILVLDQKHTHSYHLLFLNILKLI